MNRARINRDHQPDTGLEELKNDLVALDQPDAEELLEGLGDTPVQIVSNAINEWGRLDNLRSQQAYQLDVLRRAGDTDTAKILAAALVKTRQRLLMVSQDVIEAVAMAPRVREHIPNWITWPINLRPILKKHLKLRHGIDITDILAEVAEMEKAEELRFNKPPGK